MWPNRSTISGWVRIFNLWQRFRLADRRAGGLWSPPSWLHLWLLSIVPPSTWCCLLCKKAPTTPRLIFSGCWTQRLCSPDFNNYNHSVIFISCIFFEHHEGFYPGTLRYRAAFVRRYSLLFWTGGMVVAWAWYLRTFVYFGMFPERMGNEKPPEGFLAGKALPEFKE